jgi:hypothetical protein
VREAPEVQMKPWRTAMLHVLAIAFFGLIVVTTPPPFNIAAFVAWAIIVREWAKMPSRSEHQRRVSAVVVIQVTGMSALVLAAGFAPVKILDQQKARRITLPKQIMILDELAEPVQHGWDHYYYCWLNVPERLADRAVHFPARELTVGEFISAIETQTPLRHKFHHCGNGYTALWGGDCAFGLHFRVPGR